MASGVNDARIHSWDSPRSLRRSRALLALIILLPSVGVALIRHGDLTVTGRPMNDLIYLIIGAQVAFLFWLVYVSGVNPIVRVQLLGALFAADWCISVVMCVTGFTGSGQPNFALRWTHRPTSVAVGASPVQTGPVDLTSATAFDYPGFRGRDRSAVVHGISLARDWSTAPPRQLWRQPIGRGWSSWAIVGEFCVTQEQRGDDEAVVCYELRTGKPRWEHLDRASFVELMGGPGPRATPTIDRGYVYTLGATGILNCLRGEDGQRMWSKELLGDGRSNAYFGMCGSPLIVDDMVIVSPGGALGSLVAFDRRTGRQLWSAGVAAAAYSSPQLAQFATGRQVLTFNAEGIFAYEPHAGRPLWNVPWVTPPERNNVCQPIPLPAPALGPHDHVFISSGYGKGCALIDVSGQSQPAAPVVWSSTTLKAKFSSVVERDGYAYGFDDSVLTCIDLQTGERRWKQGRYGFGQLLLVDDLLLIQADTGEVVLVPASPDSHRELARFAALSEKTWNHPALAGNLLLVRNDREAACYELPVAD